MGNKQNNQEVGLVTRDKINKKIDQQHKNSPLPKLASLNRKRPKQIQEQQHDPHPLEQKILSPKKQRFDEAADFDAAVNQKNAALIPFPETGQDTKLSELHYEEAMNITIEDDFLPSLPEIELADENSDKIAVTQQADVLNPVSAYNKPSAFSPLSLSSTTVEQDNEIINDNDLFLALAGARQYEDRSNQTQSSLTKRADTLEKVVTDNQLLNETESSEKEDEILDNKDKYYLPNKPNSTKSGRHGNRKKRATMPRRSRKKIKRPNITVQEIDANRSLYWNMENYIMNKLFSEVDCQITAREMLQKFSQKAKKRRDKICNLWQHYGKQFFGAGLPGKHPKAVNKPNQEVQNFTANAYPHCYVEINSKILWHDLDIHADYETILKILNGIGAHFDTSVKRNMSDGLCIENHFTLHLHIKDLFDLLRHLDDELMADWYEIYYKNQSMYPNAYQYTPAWYGSVNKEDNKQENSELSSHFSKMVNNNQRDIDDKGTSSGMK